MMKKKHEKIGTQTVHHQNHKNHKKTKKIFDIKKSSSYAFQMRFEKNFQLICNIFDVILAQFDILR